jgi:hypothetical protein
MIVVSTKTHYLLGTQWLYLDVPTEVDATPEEIRALDGVLVVSEPPAELLADEVPASSPQNRSTSEKE